MLQANADWYWFFDQETKTLRLDMAQYVFVSACMVKKLLPQATQYFIDENKSAPFNVDDTQIYTEFYAYLEDELHLSEAQCVQISLNALAHIKYTVIGQPKSWYFTPVNVNQLNIANIQTRSLVKLNTQLDQADFLVLDNQNDFSVVMLLSAKIALTEHKILKQFDIIKVSNDRIAPVESTKTQAAFNLFA